MTVTEKTIIKSLASLGQLVTDLIAVQDTAGRLLAQKLPGLTDEEKQALLGQIEQTRHHSANFVAAVGRLKV